MKAKLKAVFVGNVATGVALQSIRDEEDRAVLTSIKPLFTGEITIKVDIKNPQTRDPGHIEEPSGQHFVTIENFYAVSIYGPFLNEASASTFAKIIENENVEVLAEIAVIQLVDVTHQSLNEVFAREIVDAAVKQGITTGTMAVCTSDLVNLVRCLGDIQPASVANNRQFFMELLDSVESLSGIAEEHGALTLADLMYLSQAILNDSYVDHMSDSSDIEKIIERLPSKDKWRKYLVVTDQDIAA